MAERRKNTRKPKIHEASFRARAHLFSLLGDELIGRDHLAVFELVKNAYDADATFARVELLGLETDSTEIVVSDDGEGMSLETITNVWLELGTEYRREQRRADQRTPRFHRLPMGEKGIGRIAVHKLGRRFTLVTRQKGGPEYEVFIDWDTLLQVKYLEEARVKIRQQGSPMVFKRGHGTRITVSALRESNWTRGEVRRLQRQITTICSPFGRGGLKLFDDDEELETAGDSFRTELKVPDHPDWLEGIPDIGLLVKDAPWRFSFKFDGEIFDWRYEFRPMPGIRIDGRKEEKAHEKLLLPHGRQSVVADIVLLKGIGPLKGRLMAFDRDPKILGLLGETSLYRGFLDYHSGIRVYRDGIRVYNYGEPSDDWLGLDLRRVQRPTERLSRNIVVGEIHISQQQSRLLREKTNREGFDENEPFHRFQQVVTAAISKFEVERALDKDRLKRLVDGRRDAADIPVEKPLADLRYEIRKAGKAVEKRLTPYVDRVEQDYATMRELMLKAGMAGLNIAVIFHEMERGIRALHSSIRDGAAIPLIEEQARQLMGLFEDIAGLLRRKRSRKVDIRELVQHGVGISGQRFERHQINVKFDLKEGVDEPFTVQAQYELLLGTLTNLIDNSVYWLRVRWPDVKNGSRRRRRMFISITDELPGGRTLLVADNGPGFVDDPDILIRPFFTRKPEGMGLGLYYTSVAMQISGGKLLFPQKGDVTLPRGMDGAVIGLFFPEDKK